MLRYIKEVVVKFAATDPYSHTARAFMNIVKTDPKIKVDHTVHDLEKPTVHVTYGTIL